MYLFPLIKRSLGYLSELLNGELNGGGDLLSAVLGPILRIVGLPANAGHGRPRCTPLAFSLPEATPDSQPELCSLLTAS